MHFVFQRFETYRNSNQIYCFSFVVFEIKLTNNQLFIFKVRCEAIVSDA